MDERVPVSGRIGPFIREHLLTGVRQRVRFHSVVERLKTLKRFAGHQSGRRLPDTCARYRRLKSEIRESASG